MIPTSLKHKIVRMAPRKNRKYGVQPAHFVDITDVGAGTHFPKGEHTHHVFDSLLVNTGTLSSLLYFARTIPKPITLFNMTLKVDGTSVENDRLRMCSKEITSNQINSSLNPHLAMLWDELCDTAKLHNRLWVPKKLVVIHSKKGCGNFFLFLHRQ